ncbi:MAG TPA: hypothetical protein DDX19_09340 [Rhodopirellula baltica]|uniref:Uncharacterized protein n=1 Tax=Rhodopirellula baltica (strain DSM 10527 / NCIMB 13988 / SH1) TaxID=243090 RepID=Q7UU30_RHOBA|nr:hypothetical protein RB3548 [Rhodopirellula baltica SH 1]HBE62928.1 hypothetical protein [Rhodopirellula baltica]
MEFAAIGMANRKFNFCYLHHILHAHSSHFHASLSIDRTVLSCKPSGSSWKRMLMMPAKA